MNLARVRGDATERPWLVQVDPEYTFRRAERGRPAVDLFVAEAWSAEGLSPVYPVSASCCLCDVTLPRLRYIVDPDRPAMEATERVQAPET